MDSPVEKGFRSERDRLFQKRCENDIMSEVPANKSVFATTRWSVVLQARSDPAAAAQGRALEELCEIYWTPVYSFIRRQTSMVEEAQDLTQAFFADLLSRSFLKSVEQERGRFRSWLLASARNFLNNEREHASALKRGGGVRFRALDWDSGEERFANSTARSETAAALFEREWSIALLASLLQRLSDEMEAAGQSQSFDVLRDCLTTDRAEFSYTAAAGELGLSVAATRTAAHRLRKRYRQLLRCEIRETVAFDHEVEDEIRCLFRSLAR